MKTEREIKFRAFVKSVNKMYDVKAIMFDGVPMIRVEEKTLFALTDCVLMQFTGLLDKNGEELYHKDIMFNDDRKENCVIEWSDEKTMWVACYVETKDAFPLWESVSNLYCKVGNAF